MKVFALHPPSIAAIPEHYSANRKPADTPAKDALFMRPEVGVFVMARKLELPGPLIDGRQLCRQPVGGR